LLARTRIRLAIAGAVALATLPLTAHAADTSATQAAGVAADTVWVVVAAVLVMFMQAGFAMLEVGFSRMKNVGTVVAKVVTHFGVAWKSTDARRYASIPESSRVCLRLSNRRRKNGSGPAHVALNTRLRSRVG